MTVQASTRSGAALLGAYLALAIGAAGILATCVCYALSPPAAAMPGVFPFDPSVALSATLKGETTMRLAGAFGVAGDLIAACGTLMFAIAATTSGRGRAAVGWSAMSLSLVLFTLADLAVGWVLPPLAEIGDRSAYLGFKVAFDAFFLLGSASFGVGLILAMVAELRHRDLLIPRLAARSAIAVGFLAVGATLGCWLGYSLNQPVGLTIAAACLLMMIIGVEGARRGGLQRRS